jgi:hypothetical protein
LNAARAPQLKAVVRFYPVMTAKRKLSSDDSTMIYKVGFPALFSVLALIGTVVGVFNIHGDLSFFIVFWPIAIAWLLWFASRLKWVSVDDSYLYVSGLRREIQIPLSEVDRVEASFMWRPKQILLRLKVPSEFGKKIVFVPQQRPLDSMRAGHPPR